jgi:hypothetical protein
MTFGEYLIGKKFDSGKFKAYEPDRWQEWALLFAQVSPASFTSQKLYLVNPLRRKYHLRETSGITKPEPAPAAEPVFKPKIP